ncbi:hypothetical protein BDV33DRAFT_120792 [Aspergillus novoparasiticus]|uniref:Uncharacterized protein n=1 Tax=Aspergillus novoparasiticus TaxID=986946 RepID=A0A5N6EML0_9EURO|nr:hypothetical protein BDV33DRAFT_120792 [Aspergillus novoparasiticus]
MIPSCHPYFSASVYLDGISLARSVDTPGLTWPFITNFFRTSFPWFCFLLCLLAVFSLDATSWMPIQYCLRSCL